jgi:hypothetical protein
MRSLKKCISDIKEKINIQKCHNSLLDGIVIGCKINYNNDKDKKNKDKKEKKIIISCSDSEETLSSGDSDDGENF